MPILDTTEVDRILDDTFGATHGPNAADEHELILLTGDPRLADDPTELAALELDPDLCPGYEPLTLPNDGDWPAASGGAKDRGFVTLASPTGAWEQAARYYGLRATDTGKIGFFSALDQPIAPTAAGGTLKIAVTVRYRSINAAD